MACVARKRLQYDNKMEFKFHHELARLAIQSGVSLSEQKSGHSKILHSLEALNLQSNLAWLAHHAEGALNATSVLKYAPLAAKNAADLGAHKEAASFYNKALKFVEYADSHIASTLYENWSYEVGLTTHMNQSVIDARFHAITLWRA
ncbi:MAG: hypothetical protein ACJAVV_002279 [Alphaproteobacteria bacterium]|jgi:hypothetical protein